MSNISLADGSPPGRSWSRPAQRLYDLITTSWVSAAVGAAAELGLADAMSTEPRSVEQIASQVGADPDALRRLLRACAELELVDQRSDDRFALTELGGALREDAPDSMRAYARWINSPPERGTMAYLADAIRTGREVFEAVHGTPVWHYLRQHPELAELFDRGMVNISAQVTGSLVEGYDFGDIRCLVDVGGGRGRMLSQLLRAYPELRGVLFDQPEVVGQPEPALQHPDLAARCRIEGGSFLESVPAGSDAYLLVSVIHNWNDEQAVRILTHCRRAMVEGGRVLLAEVLVPEGSEPAPMATFMDLSMLTHCDGKQRTAAQLAGLLERSGLRMRRIVHTEGVSVVEGVGA